MTLQASEQGTVLRPLSIDSVTISDDFWSPRIEQVRTSTLPQQEQQLRNGGQFDALRLTWRPGDANEPHIFWESDVAKWIEAASYSLAKHPDAQLEASVDEAIALLAGAQQADGYLNVYFTVVRPGERFTDLRDGHELYCAGHLMEAAAAHYAATGKRTLLEVVSRYADLLVAQFGPGGHLEGGYDGHQEVELGLIKLATATGDERYRDLALQMLDARGTEPFFFEEEAARRGTPGYFGTLFPQRETDVERFRQYNQSHQPIRDQRDAVGHSVRAMYMYAAMTDFAGDVDDPDLRHALLELWASTTDRKMYLTGGIGSDPSIEGFSGDYELPLDTAYAETCAAIGLVFWAQRMASLTSEGRFVDVLERALFNGVLSGASADGRHYFYGNPMRSRGDIARNEWFGVACCPPNFARLVQSLESYIYAQSDRSAVVNLYVSGSARFAFGNHSLDLSVQSDYPWSGSVDITIDAAPEDAVEVALRVPGWAPSHTILLNGEPVAAELQDGYVRIRREWQAADTVRLTFPITARRTWARSELESNGGRVALERGPLVYCLEGVDNAGDVAQLSLPRTAEVDDYWDENLKVVVLTAPGHRDISEGDALYRSDDDAQIETFDIKAVPYYLWANRGMSTMEIWVRES